MSEDIIDQSSLRRQIETYYLYKRGDGCYTAISLIAVIDSKVWYSVAYGHTELCSNGLTPKDLKRYLRIKRFPECEGTPIVNDKGIYTTNKAAVVPVRSKDKKEWEKGKCHNVEIFNIPKKNAIEHEKTTCLRHLIVHCSCGSSPISHIMSPMNYELLPDGRVPYLNSIVDLHGGVSLLHLSLTRNFEDFSFFGFDPVSIKVSQFIIKRQLAVGRRIDNYMMNSTILQTAKGWFEPLKKRLFLKQ